MSGFTGLHPIHTCRMLSSSSSSSAIAYDEWQEDEGKDGEREREVGVGSGRKRDLGLMISVSLPGSLIRSLLASWDSNIIVSFPNYEKEKGGKEIDL